MEKTRFFSEVVDLSHELYDRMPTLGSPITAFFPVRTFDFIQRMSQGRVGWESRMILLGEHTGTHFDCPAHFDRDGISVEKWPLEKLILPGHLLDVTHRKAREAITPADFEDAVRKSGHPIQADTAVIGWTGQDKNWGKEGFTRERPYIPAESAQWLVDHHVTLFGTDLIGLDNPEEWWEPTHTTFLKNGLPMVQQLCNLDRLVGREFLLTVLPLKMRGGTGSPVRAVALVI